MKCPYTLLVDNSNTRTKFALADGDALLPERRVLPTAEITPHALQRTLEGWQYSRAIICSVAPKSAAILQGYLRCPVHRVSAAACPDLVRGYALPSALGADRLANAAAAAALYPLPCVAVDLGTACTFDIIAQEEGRPRFLGGVISPGLPTLRGALAERTALLPPTDMAGLRTHTPPAIGGSTQAALQAGLFYGFPGMVREILCALGASFPGQKLCTVLTGGDAAHPSLSAIPADFVDIDLTFKGMLALFRCGG